MSLESPEWSDSQKRAFGFARRGVGEGLSARSALKQYRAGGGSIGNAYWFDLYKTIYNAEGWKESIEQVPPTYNIRENMFTEVDIDYREEFVITAKVSGYSEELNQRVTKYVTIESDKILTKREWLWGMQQAISETLGSPDFTIDRHSDYSAFRRVR